MKAKDKRAKYRAMSAAELDKKVVDLKEELENPLRIPETKRDIALIKTILREKELGGGA